MHLNKDLLGNVIRRRVILCYPESHAIDKPLGQPVDLLKSINIAAGCRLDYTRFNLLHGSNKLDKVKALKVP